MTRFGTYLREARTKLGWKVKELAIMLEIDPSYLTQIEIGGKWPSSKLVEEIASTLEDTYFISLYLEERHPELLRLFNEYTFIRRDND